MPVWNSSFFRPLSAVTILNGWQWRYQDWRKENRPDRELSAHIRPALSDWSQDMFLQTTLKKLPTRSPCPSPEGFIETDNCSRQLHLYVICQPDRRVLCLAVLKNRNGQFVRQHGRLWSVPLSQSIHGLGWNFIGDRLPRYYRIEV